MSWNYAQLSKHAKESGGPDEYIDLIQLAGEKIGKAKMVPYLFFTSGVGFLLGNVFREYYTDRIKQKVKTLKIDGTLKEGTSTSFVDKNLLLYLEAINKRSEYDDINKEISIICDNNSVPLNKTNYILLLSLLKKRSELVQEAYMEMLNLEKNSEKENNQ